MNIEDLLPIGSIVLLKGGEKRLMICGVKQSDLENPNKIYDYLGVFYPEGHIGKDFQYLFDHEQIDKIIFRGYEDQERKDFFARLASFYAR